MVARRVGRASKPKRDLLSTALVLGLLLTARASLADHYRVPSGSMQPTVEVGDRVLVSKAAYGLRLPLSQVWALELDAPARGDVVILDSPEQDMVLLKRVVAVEGDTVAVVAGRVHLDGSAVSEPYASRGGPDFGPTQVPRGELLVLGDNRGNSRDGRSFGFVRRQAVLGRAVAVYARDGDLTWIPLR